MPEFHLNKAGRVQILNAPFQGATIGFDNLDSFTQGYIEAMFFTDASDPDDGDLQDATFADLAPETLAKIIADCAAFQLANHELLETAYAMRADMSGEYDSERAGNDYWYTRNGHGTGFWDRDLGHVGDKLASAARYSTVDLYRGDDGLTYT